MRNIRRWLIAFSVLGCLSPTSALADVPADFELVATAGSLAPEDSNVVIRITADGHGVYEVFRAGDPFAGPLDSLAFTLTEPELYYLWSRIDADGFFTLSDTYSNDAILDRSFAQLLVRANGTSAVVTTRNISVPAFDAIVDVLNEVTPGSLDLRYDTSPPFAFGQTDVCGGTLEANIAKPGSKPPSNQTVTAARPTEPAPRSGEAHPGTRVAYHITLEEAVKRGIVRLRAKGGHYGDQVSITVDNTANQTSNRLIMDLYLEFFGAESNAANAATAESDIEGRWGGHTASGGGPTMGVDVHTRVSSSLSAPGTQGYHQIGLKTVAILKDSYVNDGAGVNHGVSSGEWQTDPPATVYPHESGHLMGLPDRYDDYRKLPSGNWRRASNREEFTNNDFANMVQAVFPQLTLAAILARLNDPTCQRVTLPMSGHDNDIMAVRTKNPLQSDIDAIIAQAGLIVEVQPGNIAIGKDATEQNFVFTRAVDVFVTRGKNQTLMGLWAACIDLNRYTPSVDREFDLGPRLADWVGIPAAAYLSALTTCVNANELFCGGHHETQDAVWRITDNYAYGGGAADQLLSLAGVDLGSQVVEFPHLTSLNGANSGTTFFIPPELYRPVVSGEGGEAGHNVPLGASLIAPLLEGVSYGFTWQLDVPSGSASTLAATTGPTSSFVPDIGGIYRIVLRSHIDDGVHAPFEVATEKFLTVADAWTETFESGTLGTGPPFSWVTNEFPWTVESGQSSTGSFSAHSAHIADNQSSRLQTTINVYSNEEITFALHVSSEAGYDALNFSIDGTVVYGWSGEVEWHRVSPIYIAPGTHVLTWSYDKDYSNSRGLDRAWIDDVFFPRSARFISVGDGSVLPKRVMLEQNRPNPFADGTVIMYGLPRAENVQLTVFDVSGREVMALDQGRREAGEHRVRVGPGLLPPGVYTYRLKAGPFMQSKRMVVLH
jgi:hypothetical protein